MYYFPFVRWFFQPSLTGGGIVGRCLMLLVILFSAFVAYQLNDTKKGKTIVFLVCLILWIAGELMYHFSHMLGQMIGAFLGVPTLLIWVGIALGVLGRLLFKRTKQT